MTRIETKGTHPLGFSGQGREQHDNALEARIDPTNLIHAPPARVCLDFCPVSLTLRSNAS